MAEVEADAHPRAACRSARSPAGLLGDEVEHTAHALRVHRHGAALLSGLRRRRSELREHLAAEVDRVLPCRVRELIDERLEDEREGIATRRAKESGRYTERHRRYA